MSKPTEEDLRGGKNIVLRINNYHLRDESVRSQLSFDIASALAAERERLAPIVYELVIAGRSAKEIAAAIRAGDKPLSAHADYCGLSPDHEGECAAVVTRMLGV